MIAGKMSAIPLLTMMAPADFTTTNHFFSFHLVEELSRGGGIHH